VAIYHFQAKVISRQQGRGIVAAAAYRAGECLFDEELGRSQNFLAKEGVVHREIILPEGAPSRWLDRETLWNEVAAGEVRRDGEQRRSQLAREVEIALPRELSQAEAVRLAQDFVREQFVVRGMVADLSVHWGTAGDGEAQPHAHVLLTMRGIDPAGRRRPEKVAERVHDRRSHRGRDPERGAGRAPHVAGDPDADAGAGGRPDRGHHRGPGGDPGDAAGDADPAGHHREAARLARLIAAARLRSGLGRLAGTAPLSEQAGFGLKQRAWNDRALVGLWRERWAEMANARLCELGHDVRIDHRSHAARGLELAPQNKVGPAASRRARDGKEGDRTEEHRAIAQRNGERLLAEPGLALQALTEGQSTFTRADLARLVHRQSDGAAQFAAVMAAVEAAPELVRVGEDGRGRARFSTAEMVEVEQRMVAAAVALNARTKHRVQDKRRLLALDDGGLGEEQRLAYLHVTRSRDLAVVVGIAGGGKSTLLGAARAAWEGQGYQVRGAALSGIAAEGLEGSAGIRSRTIASWEHAWDAGKEGLTARDVLVVDEAGMVGSRQLGRLLRRAQEAGAKLVLVGDAEQLQAIEAGAAFRAVAERVGAFAITEPRRQREGWQREATKELATARTDLALSRYAQAGMVHRHATREAAQAAAVAGWDRARRENPRHSQVLFAHERADVRALNEAARAVRRAAGELGPDHTVQTELGLRALAEGDRVYFLRNERGLGVKNGTLGTVERIGRTGPGPCDARLAVRLDGAGQGRSVTVDLATYADLDWGYAATVHKNQGATVDQAHVLATPGMDRHLTYVALSRHRHAVHLHWGGNDFGERLPAVRGRERAKDTTLDYGAAEPDPVAAYAERRALAPRMPDSAIIVPPALAAGQAPVAEGADLTAIREVLRDATPVRRQPHDGIASIPADPAPAADAPTPLPEAPPAPPAAPRPDRLVSDVLAMLGQPRPEAPAGAEPVWPDDMAGRLRRFEERLAKERAARAQPAPWPWDQVPAEAGPPVPMLAAISYQPVTAEEVAAAVDADANVRGSRDNLDDTLQRAYRDPAQARARLAALEQEAGTAAVAGRLAEKPGLLGKLRGRAWLASVDTGIERILAEGAVLRIGEQLAKQREAERNAADAFWRPLEERRRREAVEVPGLFGKALAALEAVSQAGAAPGRYGLMPWDDRAPQPDEIAWAAQVAPVWTAIQADTELHGELQRFREAAGQRLPIRRANRPDEVLSGPTAAVRTYADTLWSAESLCAQHPVFQAYVAAEPERQAQAAREKEERRRQAEHEALAPARDRVLQERMQVWRKANHPYAQFSDYGFHALWTKAEAVLRVEVKGMPAAELRQAAAKLEQADRIAAARKPAPRPGASPSPF